MDHAPQPTDQIIANLREELAEERIAREHAERQAELGLNLLYRRQAELGLLAAVARAANESKEIESGLAQALRAIGEFGEWEIGHVLTRTDHSAPLRTTHAWYVADSTRFDGFVTLTAGSEYARGVDLPGEVLTRGGTIQRAWPGPTDRSARAQCARDCGLIAGYAFPVSAGDLGDAVVELYSTRAHSAEEALFEFVPQLASQLGRLLERHWTSERLRHAQLDLERKVRERTETLATTVIELNKQMSEQRRMQQALLLHDRAVSAAGNGIALVSATDPAFPILYCNPAFERITGYSHTEITGHTYRVLMPPTRSPEEERAADVWRRTVLAGKRAQVVIRSQRKDGSWFWNQLTVSPVRDDYGMLTHFVGIIEDVSERRVTEEALQRVKETTEAANRELSRAARLKDEFLAAMSHELRTPLNAVLGLTQAMEEDVYGPLGPEQRQVMRTIADSSHHLLELINDILDLSKVESGKMVLHCDEMDGAAVAQASIRFIRESALKKRLQVTLRVEPDFPLFVADQRRVKQILVNLLTNAVKFTPTNGHLGLDLTFDHQAATVSFSVWDTGIGISPEDQKKLFQTFVQIDSKLSRSYGGTGLGLALVRGMAQLHGGQVALESEPGKGSRFTVTLPCRKLDAPVEPPISATPPVMTPRTVAPFGGDIRLVSKTGGHLLLAEDNELNRKTFVDYLTVCGYDVTVAENGLEAVRLTDEKRPDLILMDVQMPKMDGLEATRRIRANPAVATTPIIALTALAMVGDDVRCLQAGVDKYLSKPVNLRELVGVIQTLLSHSTARPSAQRN